MVRSCITFAGTRVDQLVAIEILEAVRPQGVQAALDALDHTQNQTDEKRRSLELALQKARYEGGRIERQYQATEPENRLVAAELEKRWNNALTHVTEMERLWKRLPLWLHNSRPSSANNCWHWAMTWNSSGTILVPR